MNHISSHYIKSSSSCSLLLLFQYYWDCAGFVVVVVAVGASAVWKSTSLQLVAPRTSPQRRGGEQRLLLLAKQPMQPRTSIRIRISHKACTYIRTKYLLPPLQILHIYLCLCRQGRCYSGSTGCRFGCYSFPDQPTPLNLNASERIGLQSNMNRMSCPVHPSVGHCNDRGQNF